MMNPTPDDPTIRPPTIDQALDWLASQPDVSVEDVTTCLSQVMFRNPEGGFIVSDAVDGDQFYRKMTGQEIMAEMRGAKPVHMMMPTIRKMSYVLKKCGVMKNLPFAVLRDGDIQIFSKP